jgi:hypothetical protein
LQWSPYMPYLLTLTVPETVLTLRALNSTNRPSPSNLA